MALPARSWPTDGRIAAFLFALFAILYVSTITGGEDQHNGASRLALVEAIVEHRSFSIDRSAIAELTSDKAYVRGHFYSDKAPGQSLAAAPLYWALYRLGITFSSHRSDAEIALKVPFALLTAAVPALFFVVSRSYVAEPAVRLPVSIAVGAGTSVFVLSGAFLSHGSAAALLLMSFYFALRARQHTKWLWLSGAAGGAATFFEYPALLLATAIHLDYLVAGRRRAEIWKAFAAMLPFLACILFLNLRITGNMFDFPYYHTGNWRGSPFRSDNNRFELRHITLQHAAQMLFFGASTPGGQLYFKGLLLYSPFVLFGLLFARKKHLVWLVASLAVAVLYLGSVTKDAVGGCTFSSRYLIITLPFIALPALDFARRRPREFAATAVASIAINFVGAATVPLSCARLPLIEAFAHGRALLFRAAALLPVLLIAASLLSRAIARDAGGAGKVSSL